ncbi:BEACH domain-containing protein [Reticulomyxa filosa]|uniref:BEACH domain-containing protein n=1 Tax=Reticulomyxa filosa TaxID=46433 RepID=X6MDQ5_RETFI|nr:BEACH domain-containing protein [Reticulomyxa filosa]|eukprot:ETO11175.1 BEACH domain-containing protein [Reticulomyxa filosa]
MFASNILHLVEICSLTLQNYFAFYLLPRKATIEKKKAKPVRRHTHVARKLSVLTGNTEVPSPSASPNPPAIVQAEKPHWRKERRHSFSGNLAEIVQLRSKAMTIQTNPPVSPRHGPVKAVDGKIGTNEQFAKHAHQTSEIGTYGSDKNNSYLEQIPPPSKIARRLLEILQACKSALDDRMAKDEEENTQNEERASSYQDLETLYNTCRKAVQSVLIFFLHKSLELANKNRHLEKLLPLVIEYQQVLFFTDMSEPDFFFLGLMQVLTKLLTDVARYGDKTNLSQTKERLVQHCLSVWDCVLMYQSHFLARFLSKESELNEKLRLIITKRSLFLQWLRKGGLAKAQTTFQNIFGKVWNERYVNEKATLREKFEKDRIQAKTQHENVLIYEGKLKLIPMNVMYGSGGAVIVKDLQSIEHARQLARQQQFYYRDLFSRNKWFELIVLKLRVQSALWLQMASLPWDEAWCIDFVEGPHRMRKILKRHTEFIRIYKANRRQFMQEYYSIHDSYYRRKNKQKAQKRKLNALTTPNNKTRSRYSLALLSNDSQNKVNSVFSSGEDESSNVDETSLEKSIGSSTEDQEFVEPNEFKHAEETSEVDGLETIEHEDGDDVGIEIEVEDEDEEEEEQFKDEYDEDDDQFAMVHQGAKVNRNRKNSTLRKRTSQVKKHEQEELEEDTHGESGFTAVTPPPPRTEDEEEEEEEEEDEENNEHKFETHLFLTNQDSQVRSNSKSTTSSQLLNHRSNQHNEAKKKVVPKRKAAKEEEDDDEDNDDYGDVGNDEAGADHGKWIEEYHLDDFVDSDEKNTQQEDYTLGNLLPFEQDKDTADAGTHKDEGTLGIVDRISRVLAPGDVFDPKRTYNCSTMSGLNEDHGIVLLCRTAMYFFYRIRIAPETGELKEIEPNLQNQVAFTTTFDMNEPELGPLLTVKKIRTMMDYLPSIKSNTAIDADDADLRDVSNSKNKGKLVVDKHKGGEATNHMELTEFDGLHENKEPLRYTYDSLREVYKRQYQLQQIAIEFFLLNGSNFLLIFPKRNERDLVFEEVQNADSFLQRRQRKNQQSEMQNLKTITSHQTSDTLHHIQAAQQRTRFQMVAETLGRTADNISVVTRRWENGHMSNFAYLMFLNTLAGRSYNDITQYPVFPWILRDYESEVLNLTNPLIYRDLSKPMGAQTEPRASEFKERFETWDDPTGKAPPWHYGSHYSCAAIVLYFLIRLEPFTKLIKNILYI